MFNRKRHKKRGIHHIQTNRFIQNVNTKMHLNVFHHEQQNSRLLKNKPYDEVLGAAQFTERTSISCQELSKVVKSCQKLSKVVKSCQKLSKVIKSYQKLS